MRVRAKKGIFFSGSRRSGAREKLSLRGGARARKRPIFQRQGQPSKKMLQWEVLKNAQNRVFGGLEANYNQDSIFGPKGRASQSLHEAM